MNHLNRLETLVSQFNSKVDQIMDKCCVDLERIKPAKPVEESIFLHDRYQDPLINNLPVGKLGAMRYVLDHVTGNPITRGYHSLYLHQGTLMGTTGAVSHTVKFDGGDEFRRKELEHKARYNH